MQKSTMQEVREIKEKLSKEYALLTFEEKKERFDKITQEWLNREIKQGRKVEKTSTGYSVTSVT